MRATLSMGDSEVEAARQNSIKLKKKIQDRTGMTNLGLISPTLKAWRMLVANARMIKFSSIIITQCGF